MADLTTKVVAKSATNIAQEFQKAISGSPKFQQMGKKLQKNPKLQNLVEQAVAKGKVVDVDSTKFNEAVKAMFVKHVK